MRGADDPVGQLLESTPRVGIDRGICMGDLGSPVGPVCSTDKDLREHGRRGLEDRERQDAIFKAEQAGRIAAAAGSDRSDPSEADVARFGVQLQHIDDRVFTMAHLGILLTSEGTQRSESRRFAGSLRNAERVELRLDQAPERARQ